MTSFLPPLPPHAPLTHAMKQDPNLPTAGALIAESAPAGPDGPNMTFISTTVSNASGAAPRQMIGVAQPHQLQSNVFPSDPTYAADQAQAGVAQLTAGIASLGKDVSAETFGTVKGVEELMKSLAPSDVMVQTYSQGKLTTRVVSDPVELRKLDALVLDTLVQDKV